VVSRLATHLEILESLEKAENLSHQGKSKKMCSCLWCITVSIVIRDVTKFEFEFDNVRTSNIFNRFKIRRML